MLLCSLVMLVALTVHKCTNTALCSLMLSGETHDSAEVRSAACTTRCSCSDAVRREVPLYRTSSQGPLSSHRLALFLQPFLARVATDELPPLFQDTVQIYLAGSDLCVLDLHSIVVRDLYKLQQCCIKLRSVHDHGQVRRSGYVAGRLSGWAQESNTSTAWRSKGRLV